MSAPENVSDFIARQIAMVRCDGCGTEFEDLEAATDLDGHSDKGCPNRCGRLTTPVYWPSDEDDGRWRKYA